MENNFPNLISKVLAGELDVYREIVRIFASDDYRVAAPMIGARAAWEGILQETLLIAYERLDAFDAEPLMGPWLIGIARNLVRNEPRRRLREDLRSELYARFTNQTKAGTEAAFTSEITSAPSRCRRRLGETAKKAFQALYDYYPKFTVGRLSGSISTGQHHKFDWVSVTNLGLMIAQASRLQIDSFADRSAALDL